MDNQFADEPLEEIPNIDKEYYVSPLTKSKGLTHLMKLVLCAKNNDRCLEMIKEIIKDDPDKINEKCEKGWTALLIACRNCSSYSNIEVVKILSNYPNIDINEQNYYGCTALMLACGFSNNDSNIETIKLLLDHPDIDVNKHDDDGWTPLMRACRISNTDSNIETVKLLLDRSDIDVNKQETDGWTALILACRYSSTDSNVETVKLLLNRSDIDVNKQNGCGHGALMLSCWYSNTGSNIETIELLLSYPDIDVNKCDNYGWTALKFACVYGNADSDVEIVRLLLDHPNIDINVQNGRDGMIEKIRSCETIRNIFAKYMSNSDAHINKDILEVIIEKDKSHIDLLIPKIFNPLIFDTNLMIKMLTNCNDMDKIIYYCYLHTTVKKTVLKNMPDHKEEIYYRPNNIIALCSEINFKLKFKTGNEVFEELDDKLKFIFDIKNEFDMVNKIRFYLCDK